MSAARDVESIERRAWTEMYAGATTKVRETLGLSARRFDGALALAASNAPDTQFNRAFGFGVDAPASERELDAVIAHMRASAAPRWWLQPAPGEGDLIAAIEARGFQRAPRSWAKFARDATPARQVETDLVIEQIGPAGSGDFGRIICAAFHAPPILGTWFLALMTQPHWRFYLAYDQHVAVAGAAMWCDGESAYLLIAGTDANARGRGAQGALMARRIEDARAAGARILITETGEKQPGVISTSYDNMVRHGFAVVHARPNYAPPEMQ